MTISVTITSATYTGNGSMTGPYAIPFWFGPASDLVVTVAGSTVTAFTTSATNTDTASLTFTSAPANGAAIVIKRVTPITQSLDLTRGGDFDPTLYEAALDRTARIDQDIAARVTAVETAVADTPEAVAASAAAAAASATTASTAAATATTAATTATTAATAAQTARDQTLAVFIGPSGPNTTTYEYLPLDAIAGSFNGSTTTFNLLLGGNAYTPTAAAQILVHVNGVYQVPGAGYTVSTSTITFADAPYAGSSCTILAMKTTGGVGPGYTATSATSLVTAGSGSKAFTTQAGLAYTVGARIRATSVGTSEWMEGLVTAYSGTTLTVTMDANSGTGTHADWNINLAGQQGAAGPPGSGTGDMLAANNLSDLSNKSTARTNLGVRSAALDSIAASFNGSLTAFALAVSAAAFTPRAQESIMCVYNGVLQIPGSAFTLSGSTITFTFTPAAGDTCSLWAVSA